jgi:hypothetical protein
MLVSLRILCYWGAARQCWAACAGLCISIAHIPALDVQVAELQRKAAEICALRAAHDAELGQHAAARERAAADAAAKIETLHAQLERVAAEREAGRAELRRDLERVAADCDALRREADGALGAAAALEADLAAAAAARDAARAEAAAVRMELDEAQRLIQSAYQVRHEIERVWQRELPSSQHPLRSQYGSQHPLSCRSLTRQARRCCELTERQRCPQECKVAEVDAEEKQLALDQASARVEALEGELTAVRRELAAARSPDVPLALRATRQSAGSDEDALSVSPVSARGRVDQGKPSDALAAAEARVNSMVRRVHSTAVPAHRLACLHASNVVKSGA